MKATLRIPTNEQFAFIEFEMEVSGLSEAFEAYDEATGHFKASTDGVGLSTKEWNRCLDKYLTDFTMSSDEGERMNKAQRWFIHELDKSSNRLKAKE